MPRYRLTISYDGTDFCGWQKQEPKAPVPGEVRSGAMRQAQETGLKPGSPGRIALRTVQAVVERAVREVVREDVALVGASRTDSGVHARGQVAAFTTSDSSGGRGWPADRGLEPLVRAVNARLPDDVLVCDAAIVRDEFNPIADCVAKGYSYTFHVGGDRPLWNRRYVHHVWVSLDAGQMADAAGRFVGAHDFAAFAAAGHGRQSTVRRIDACTVAGAGEMIRLEVSGNGFLYNMVRIIAGTLFEVGRGRLEPGDIADILASGDRRNAGPTMPPEGLCLQWIRYESCD